MIRLNIQDAKCQSLERVVPVACAKKDGGEFEIEAYTGASVDRPWGKLTIATNGIRAKQKMPILLNHDTGKIVGYSYKSWVDGSFFVGGKFSDSTEAGKEARALAREGFPWQASIGVRPLKVFGLKAGESTLCNNQKVVGPAELWLESEVFETSFVPLGADSRTNITTFSEPAYETEAQTLARQEWRNDPALRAEFEGDFEAFQAYRENARFCMIKK